MSAPSKRVPGEPNPQISQAQVDAVVNTVLAGHGPLPSNHPRALLGSWLHRWFRARI